MNLALAGVRSSWCPRQLNPALIKAIGLLCGLVRFLCVAFDTRAVMRFATSGCLLAAVARAGTRQKGNSLSLYIPLCCMTLSLVSL